MATDLEARATARRDTITDAAAEITLALSTARGELATAKADQTAARAVLDVCRAEESAVRAEIAAVANPADAETFEDQLRDVLVATAAARVAQRDADERVAAGDEVVARLGGLSARAEAAVRAAAAHLAWAAEHTALGTRLRAAVAAPPLDTVVADAGALLGGPEADAADDRIDELLPTELRSRAEARAAEAADVLDRAHAAARTTAEAADAASLAAEPLLAAVDSALRALAAAEAGLASYAGSAEGRLAWARHALARVAGLDDLSTFQAAAVSAANNADGLVAAGEESALATAIAAEAAARQDVDDAILAARIADPEGDPETVQAVVDARDALADPAIQDPLNDARTAYTDASRAALDAWEVEVPAAVWSGLGDRVRARRVLEELSSNTERTAIVDALGEAEDALAAALDARDTALLAGWAASLDHAARAGALAAATVTADDRARQYLQGDGAAGRVPAEL